MLFKLSNLNSNLALTLGYLNPALNNSALNINTHVFDLYTLFTWKTLGPVHMSWPIFWKTDIFISVIAFLPHVNGVFAQQKRRFLKTVSSRIFFKGQLLIYVKRRFSDTMTYHTVY